MRVCVGIARRAGSGVHPRCTSGCPWRGGSRSFRKHVQKQFPHELSVFLKKNLEIRPPWVLYPPPPPPPRGRGLGRAATTIPERGLDAWEFAAKSKTARRTLGPPRGSWAVRGASAKAGARPGGSGEPPPPTRGRGLGRAAQRSHTIIPMDRTVSDCQTDMSMCVCVMILCMVSLAIYYVLNTRSLSEPSRSEQLATARR